MPAEIQTAKWQRFFGLFLAIGIIFFLGALFGNEIMDSPDQRVRKGCEYLATIGHPCLKDQVP